MIRLRNGFLAAACAALLAFSAAPPAAKDEDPIAAEIARWSEFLKTHQSNAEFWADTKKSLEPALANAEKALASGKRLRALQYLGSAQGALAGEVYTSGVPKDRLENAAAFDAEWKRMGTVLGKALDPPSPAAMDGVRPAAVRAIGEATLPQVRGYYDASLEYGHNTMPVFGYYYIGVAQGQLEFANFCRSISEPSAPPPPPLRSVAAELDALENDLLAAYRPPASIDRHSEFIGASATVNEARRLDAAGLRYGALLRYLQAAARTAPLRVGGAPAADADTVHRRLAEFDARLSAENVDHSIGRTVLQTAQVDIANAESRTMPPSAAIVAGDVLPRYFAALEPARPAPPRPDTQVTVTLVRWPYT
jgi:hypothetical protein